MYLYFWSLEWFGMACCCSVLPYVLSHHPISSYGLRFLLFWQYPARFSVISSAIQYRQSERARRLPQCIFCFYIFYFSWYPFFSLAVQKKHKIPPVCIFYILSKSCIKAASRSKTKCIFKRWFYADIFHSDAHVHKNSSKPFKDSLLPVPIRLVAYAWIL